MNLYLLRHGIAVEPGAPGYADDSLRPLTEEGVEKMRRIAKGMRALELEFDLLLSSPYVRAKQTAAIVAAEFHPESKLKLSDHLACGGSPEQLMAELNQTYRGRESVLLVGHEPYLSELISVLLTGQPNVPLVFKKGSLCKITAGLLRHGCCAELDWLLTPRQLRLLANIQK